MVFLSTVLAFAKPKKSRRFLRGSFVDTLRLWVAGGAGGSGRPQYGGPGGAGGCVYCRGKEGARLEALSRRYPDKIVKAKKGSDSTKNKIVGAPGVDSLLEVPLGIRIFVDNEKIADINSENDTCILARGGPGGVASSGYLGREGQQRYVRLDLRLIADVGLVGFPNAGKSTLLRALSRATPKVASYPFTTVRPNIGVMEFPDLRQISVADLPGLVEGAHMNIGMGYNFLKHVERTRLLMLVVDIQGFALSVKHPHRSCLETVLLLNRELEKYDSELISKPAFLVVNKMDTRDAAKKFDEIKDTLAHLADMQSTFPEQFRPERCLKFEHIINICAQQKQDVQELKEFLRFQLDLSDQESSTEELTESLKNQIMEKGPTLT